MKSVSITIGVMLACIVCLLLGRQSSGYAPSQPLMIRAGKLLKSKLKK